MAAKVRPAAIEITDIDKMRAEIWLGVAFGIHPPATGDSEFIVIEAHRKAVFDSLASAFAHARLNRLAGP